jgi:hypothetical protein
MSKILIENYRGFDIMFDTNYEKFQCIITDENSKESVSFAAMKKFIDDYKKENQLFKPFWVEPIPGSYKVDKLKIIGIRKDERFVAEKGNGEKIQISDYELKDYMLIISENENALKLLQELNEKEKLQNIENSKNRKQIISTLNIITLNNYKNLLQQ